MTADDVWIHRIAVSMGIRTRQVADRSRTPLPIPGTRGDGLFVHNVIDGGNDAAIAATYRLSDVHAIMEDRFMAE
jgi:hypothetical protein